MLHNNTKEFLIDSLVKDGYLKTPVLIEAFKKIDRQDFVPPELKPVAYENYPLSIGFGQTISQPLTVAFMLELLEPKAGEKILDIGAGSGWQTSILAEVVGSGGKIIAIERIPEIETFGEANIKNYGFLEKGTVEIFLGDGAKGFEEQAPYDKIIAAASAAKIPDVWKEQLKIGGRIVAPVGESVVLLEKTSQNQFSEKSFFGFAFVPLVSGKIPKTGPDGG